MGNLLRLAVAGVFVLLVSSCDPGTAPKKQKGTAPHDKARKHLAFPQQESGRLSGDPIASVKAALPEGYYVLRVEKEVSPWHRKPGKGTAIYVAAHGKQYAKAQFSAVVFVMPRDYQDDVTVAVGAQTGPPRLIATTLDAKVYCWGGTGTGLSGSYNGVNWHGDDLEIAILQEMIEE